MKKTMTIALVLVLAACGGDDDGGRSDAAKKCAEMEAASPEEAQQILDLYVIETVDDEDAVDDLRAECPDVFDAADSAG